MKTLNIEAKHTPGPWREKMVANIEGAELFYREVQAGDGFFDEETRKGFHMTGFISPLDSKLLAAAPELLSALKELADWAGYNKLAYTNVELMEKVDMAIAKAEGR